MNHAKHARALIASSKGWLSPACELDTEERKWHKANVALAKDYLRLQAANAKLRAACGRALNDLKTVNAAAIHCGLHPFTLGERDLTDALAETTP